MKLSQLAKQAYTKTILSSGELAEVQNLLLFNLFPNQFEYYFIALELENSKKTVTDRFIFPILPTSINSPNNLIQNVQKTAGGVVSNYVSGFTPNQIQISGHFGRDFKMMVFNRKNYTEYSKPKNINELWQNSKNFFNSTVYTGYGCYNMLKQLFEKSKELDMYGKPYQTIFYNLVYSTINYVQLMSLDSNMTFEKNRIHNYTLTMKSLGTVNNPDEIARTKKIVAGVSTINGFKSSINQIKSLL